MDSVFQLSDQAARITFCNSMIQIFGCTYICLWSNLPRHSNILAFVCGLYNGESSQPSTSSSASLAQNLFNEYGRSLFNISDDRVPGLAFKTNNPCIELQESNLLSLASNDIQIRFYQEAGIKAAFFLGCNNGEIELGFSNMMSQDDMQMILRNIFPEQFPSPNIDQNPPSSSSSLSTMDSPEYSSLLFNISPTPRASVSVHIPPEAITSAPSLQPILPLPTTTSTTSSQLPQPPQAIQSFSQAHSFFPFPSLETDIDAAMTRAILAVLTSSSSTTHHQSQQSLPSYTISHPTISKSSAFKRYRRPNLSSSSSTSASQTARKYSMLKRSFAFLRTLNLSRNILERNFPAAQPTGPRLHHMIAERRRREKQNENFQALRALLPPGTKKDKASILTTAKETLRSLLAEVENLKRRNEELEAQVMQKRSLADYNIDQDQASLGSNTSASSSDDHQRLQVEITHLPESSSGGVGRVVDLQVSLRGQIYCPQVDILIRLLEFIKQDQNLHLISVDAQTQVAETISINHIRLRLRVEGSEWDESAFQEAVGRLVADVAHLPST